MAGPIGKTAPDELNRIKAEVRRAHADKLERLTSPYISEAGKMHVHLVQGTAGHVVPEFVAHNEIDLVVMGTVNRTDVPGLFMGNTAEIILSRVACSVLAVKPDDFQTPIKPALEAEEQSYPQIAKSA